MGSIGIIRKHCRVNLVSAETGQVQLDAGARQAGALTGDVLVNRSSILAGSNDAEQEVRR